MRNLYSHIGPRDGSYHPDLTHLRARYSYLAIPIPKEIIQLSLPPNYTLQNFNAQLETSFLRSGNYLILRSLTYRKINVTSELM